MGMDGKIAGLISEDRFNWLSIIKSLRAQIMIMILIFTGKIMIILAYPIQDLGTTSWLIDDSFIMARIARNLAIGCGYSFDCVQLTSGAPLTWTILTAPHHLLFDAITAMKITMIASSFIGGLCTLVVFVLARHLYNVRVAWGAFILATFLLSLFFTPMNGMETSLFALLCLLSLTVYALYFRADRIASLATYALLGSLLGLTNLTRGDGILVSFALVTVELLLLISYPAQRRMRLARLSVLVGTAGAITLVLVGWSLIADGVLLPANQSGRRFIALQNVMDAQYQLIPDRYMQQVILNFYSLIRLIGGTVGSGILAICALVWPLRYADRSVRLVVLIYIVTFLAFLGLYQHYFPDAHGLRYMVFPGYLFTIFLARAADYLLERAHWIKAKTVAYGVIVAGLLSLGGYQYLGVTGGLPVIPTDGNTTWRAQLNEWVNANLPPGTGFAAKDHGQLAYFTAVRVVDLAGIIQPELIDALKAGNLQGFLADNQVEYILLNDTLAHRVFTEAYAMLDLGEPVLQIREAGANDTWEVYRLRP